MSLDFYQTPYRHAEFISASMARGLMMVCAKKWTLKQVQGDAVIGFEGI